MKPSLAPDFFRLPPPPGRSRESAIRLDAQGRLWDHGQLVQHREMQRAFLGWIDRHPDDGRFILNNGYDWTYFEVEDVPFRVTAVRRTEQGLEVRLDDETEELLNAPAWTGPTGAIYLQVKGGRFDARLERDTQAALGDALVETPAGVAFWSPKGPIPILDARPGPAHEGPILP